MNSIRRRAVIGLVLLGFLLGTLAVFAQIRPKDYPAASRLQPTDIFVITQNPGATNEATRKATWDVVSASVSNGATFYISKEGTDVTAQIGRPDKPWLTITGAVAKIHSAGLTGEPTLIRVGPGQFDQGPSDLILPSNASLQGSGRGVTIISGLISNASTRALLSPGDNSTLQSFTLLITNRLALCTPIGPLNAQPACTNVTFLDVEVDGHSDAILVVATARVAMTFQNCFLHSAYDVVVLNGTSDSMLKFINCRLEAAHVAEGINTGTISVIAGNAGTVQVYDGALIALNGVTETIVVSARFGSLNVEIYGATLVAASTNGTICAVTNWTGSVTLIGVSTTNTVTSAGTGILNVGASWSGFIRNPPLLVSGSRSNQASDHTLVFQTGSIGATNWLLDSGWRSNHAVTLKTNPTIGQTFTLNGHVGIWTNYHEDYNLFMTIEADPATSIFSLDLFAQNWGLEPGIIDGTNLLMWNRPGMPSWASITGSWGSLTNSLQSLVMPATDGRLLRIARDSGAGKLSIFPQRGQTIEGMSSLILDKPFQSAELLLCGTNWLALGANPGAWTLWPSNSVSTKPTIALGTFGFWNSNGLSLWKVWNTNGTTEARQLP